MWSSSAHGSVEIEEAASARLTVLAGDLSVGSLGGPAEISAGAGCGRIHNALRNSEGSLGLEIHATTAYGGITARSLCTTASAPGARPAGTAPRAPGRPRGGRAIPTRRSPVRGAWCSAACPRPR